MIPIEKNRNYIIDINGMTHEGQGVGRIDNFTIFVDGALKDEQAEIKIIKVNKNYGVGKLLKILKTSPDRCEPFCPTYKRCGGCNIQHINYEAGLKFKSDLVKQSIKRIGGLGDVPVFNTIGMEKPFAYRNKAQNPVGSYRGQIHVGFFAKGSHQIIDCPVCPIQHGTCDKIKTIIKEFIHSNDISIYDESTGKGLVRHIVTRFGFRTEDVMVILVINGEDIPRRGELIEKLKGEIPHISSIVLNINKAKTNVVMGKVVKAIYGKDGIFDYIGRFKFKISPQSFFQVNPIQTEVLYKKVLEYASLTGQETVFDLYCGIGTISLFLSGQAKRVYGVEIVDAAIKDARKNAKLNGVGNVEFITGETQKVVPALYKEGIKADVVVVDPPRKGCEGKVLDTIIDMKPVRIVYVSCNPATLARDLRYLADGGYNVQKVQPVDMFPWTMHVECVALMSRIDK